MRLNASKPLPGRQRGLALLVLLSLFAVTGAYLLVSALNRESVALSLARADKNRDVMLHAKAALIAWSASESLQTQSGGTYQPGALPCPDRKNNGIAESSCGGSDRLGRLPYQTLGIAELRDASGERLWYAVSSSFRRLSSNVINSDTQGTLSVSGLTSANNVIAVVLAPGARLGTQDRSPDEATCTANDNKGQPCNTAVNYLEDTNGIANTTSFVTKTENLTDPTVANLFNDQLLAITQRDLMSVVEPVVAARIARDIAAQYLYDPTDTSTSTQWSDTAGPNKSRYFDAWGGFPFSATFADPGSSSFTGTAGTIEGLLPVVSNLTYTWSSGSVIQTGGSGTVWGGSSCAPANSNTELGCNIWYISGAPTIRISGTVNNVGRSFVQLTRLSDVSCSGCSLSARTLAGSLNGAGDGIVTLDATLSWVPSSWTNVTLKIKNDNLLTSGLISPTDGIAGWFTKNEWHKQTYYAVSPGWAPGGGGACVAGSTCLTVNNLGTTPTNNKRAILILAGRSLAGAARPNATLSDYLEGQNASTGDRVFEHGLSSTTSGGGALNDRVVVVAP